MMPAMVKLRMTCAEPTSAPRRRRISTIPSTAATSAVISRTSPIVVRWRMSGAKVGNLAAKLARIAARPSKPSPRSGN